VVFVEARFILFFAVVAAAYWSLPNNRARKWWLLATSYFFYGVWDWRFLFLLIGSTAVDYLAALYIDRTDDHSKRRTALWLAIAFNLSILGFFKYFDFFVTQLADLLRLFGVEPHIEMLGIVLPVGISFYTFQTMSYTIDVYRRRLKANSNFLDVALFVAFFPQLVAGPIVRAGTFLPQLLRLHKFEDVDLRRGLLLCLVGYFKKAVVADNIAPLIDPIWANHADYDWASVVAAQVLFLVQIYCDFSGYADIAVGTAALLGFWLPRNFNAPYLAVNLTQLWQRWHITLGSWFRDYVFVPLLGGRRGLLPVGGNLILVMGLVGLWHGANWTFVTWGLLQGVGLAALAVFHRTRISTFWARMPVVVAVALTFAFDALTIAFFRSPDMATAFGILTTDLTGSAGSLSLGVQPYVLFSVLALIHWCWQEYKLEDRLAAAPAERLAIGYGAAFALCFALTPREIRPFIYFQF
jgi:alginate O-acetyltransferase complex protein AlgI